MSHFVYSRREILAMIAGGIALSAIGPLALPHGVRTAAAFGDTGKVQLARLQYPGDTWNLSHNALDALLREVNAVTSIPTANQSGSVSLSSGDFSSYPLVFVTGNRPFSPWTPADHQRLRRFFAAGGMMVFDSSDPDADGGFRQSVTRELAQLFPDQKLARVSSQHVLYKSFYLCRGNEGRTTTSDHTDAIQENGRIQVLYLYNDLLGAYDRSTQAFSRTQDYAFRLGVNIVMYALCLTYKDDQVHVPFLLRRRQWTVP